jgi:hypothetical protein
MDTTYFLEQRTKLIRQFYEGAVEPFLETKYLIDKQLPPFVPRYSEDPEPAYLEEWIDAATCEQLVGLSCVSLLSDSLKLYFGTLQRDVIGFQFNAAEAKAFKDRGFLQAHKMALGEILDTNWSDCPVDFEIIEQVVLARNRGQHGTSFVTMNVQHDGRTLREFPSPFFARDHESFDPARVDSPFISILAPSVEVTRDKLFTAIDHVEKLAHWIDSRDDELSEWQRRARLKL